MMDWETDGNGNQIGHGEFVARMAAGQDYGVAKNAGLYIIKYKQGYTTGPNSGVPNQLRLAPARRAALDKAWFIAVEDALQTFRGVNTKAVINYSAGKSPESPGILED
jgi:hypothetical protein